jgi:hypothetical protein
VRPSGVPVQAPGGGGPMPQEVGRGRGLHSQEGPASAILGRGGRASAILGKAGRDGISEGSLPLFPRCQLLKRLNLEESREA